MKKNKSKNPHCPVLGCRTDKPHADDPIAAGLIHEFSVPEKLAYWVLGGMAELRESICRDLAEKKVFAWLTRLRQPEELYVRTLYALFIANDKELHHILSGAMPNGLSGMYSKVNALVFGGRGLLQAPQAGLNFGEFVPMDILNDGAHVSFAAFLTCIGIVKNPQYFPPDFPTIYFRHLTGYCKNLDYMHGMFKAGKERQHVLSGLINLHKPASHWQEEQQRIRHST
jgi:hypothetical protein